MDYPKVEVQEITDERELLVNTTAPKGVNLGGSHDFMAALAEIDIDALRQSIRANQKRVFLLSWEGNKVPRGVVIMGSTIAWTQHGRVLDKDAKDIGTYDRLVEFGGDSGNEQKMLIYADVPELIVQA